MKKIDLSKFVPRTDLAFEELSGKDIEVYKNDIIQSEAVKGNVKILKVDVKETGKEIINKKPGLYYSIDTSAVVHNDHDELKELENTISEVIHDLFDKIEIKQDDLVLVIGLGNKNVTPDSLGPKICENILITKHIFDLQPENIEEGFRPVCALSPGVMGTTGIETFDIVESVVKKVKPNLVIVVDALAARSIKRVNNTIQITNTGIHPGSGVGNKRKEISKDTLGVEVLAIGVPTVVDAVSITSDTIDYLLRYLDNELNNEEPSNRLVTAGSKVINPDEVDLPDEETRKHFLGEIGRLGEEEKRQLIYEVLTPTGYNMMVTPKEVDDNIVDLTNVISNAIDISLHEKVH